MDPPSGGNSRIKSRGSMAGTNSLMNLTTSKITALQPSSSPAISRGAAVAVKAILANSNLVKSVSESAAATRSAEKRRTSTAASSSSSSSSSKKKIPISSSDSDSDSRSSSGDDSDKSEPEETGREAKGSKGVAKDASLSFMAGMTQTKARRSPSGKLLSESSSSHTDGPDPVASTTYRGGIRDRQRFGSLTLIPMSTLLSGADSKGWNDESSSSDTDYSWKKRKKSPLSDNGAMKSTNHGALKRTGRLVRSVAVPASKEAPLLLTSDSEESDNQTAPTTSVSSAPTGSSIQVAVVNSATATATATQLTIPTSTGAVITDTLLPSPLARTVRETPSSSSSLSQEEPDSAVGPDDGPDGVNVEVDCLDGTEEAAVEAVNAPVSIESLEFESIPFSTIMTMDMSSNDSSVIAVEAIDNMAIERDKALTADEPIPPDDCTLRPCISSVEEASMPFHKLISDQETVKAPNKELKELKRSKEIKDIKKKGKAVPDKISLESAVPSSPPSSSSVGLVVSEWKSDEVSSDSFENESFYCFIS